MIVLLETFVFCLGAVVLYGLFRLVRFIMDKIEGRKKC